MDIYSIAQGLTRQKSGFELSRHLIQRIDQLFMPHEVDVFEVFGIPGNYRAEDLPEKPTIVVRRFNYDDTVYRKKSDQSEFIEAIRNGEPVRLKSDGSERRRMVFPVTSQNGPLRLVVVSDYDEEADRQTLLGQTVQLFSNLIQLHDTHERDLLTGLMNRATFEEFYKRSVINRPESTPLTFLGMCDIDHFRKINETHGHQAGDRVLLDLAHIMEDSFRYNDALFRFGGEEFVVLFKCDNAQQAASVLDRYRQAVEDYGHRQSSFLTLSAGFVQCHPLELSSTVIGKADIALFQAKEQGRNRVVGYDQLVADGMPA